MFTVQLALLCILGFEAYKELLALSSLEKMAKFISLGVCFPGHLLQGSPSEDRDSGQQSTFDGSPFQGTVSGTGAWRWRWRVGGITKRKKCDRFQEFVIRQEASPRQLTRSKMKTRADHTQVEQTKRGGCETYSPFEDT